MREGGGIAPGLRRTATSLVDIAPTVLDFAGVSHPAPHYRGREVHALRGRALRPWLEGRAEQVHPAGTSTGWELWGRRAVRQDQWKAVYVPDLEGVSHWALSMEVPKPPIVIEQKTHIDYQSLRTGGIFIIKARTTILLLVV